MISNTDTRLPAGAHSAAIMGRDGDSVFAVQACGLRVFVELEPEPCRFAQWLFQSG